MGSRSALRPDCRCRFCLDAGALRNEVPTARDFRYTRTRPAPRLRVTVAMATANREADRYGRFM